MEAYSTAVINVNTHSFNASYTVRAALLLYANEAEGNNHGQGNDRYIYRLLNGVPQGDTIIERGIQNLPNSEWMYYKIQVRYASLVPYPILHVLENQLVTLLSPLSLLSSLFSPSPLFTKGQPWPRSYYCAQHSLRRLLINPSNDILIPPMMH